MAVVAIQANSGCKPTQHGQPAKTIGETIVEHLMGPRISTLDSRIYPDIPVLKASRNPIGKNGFLAMFDASPRIFKS